MFLNYPDFKVWALDIEVEVYVAKPYHSQCFTSDLIHSLNIIFLWSISFIQLLVFAKSWKIRVILKGWIHILYGFKNFKIIFKVKRFLLNPDWQYMVVELIECSLVKIFFRIHLRPVRRFYGAYLFNKSANSIFKILLQCPFWRKWRDFKNWFFKIIQ